MVTKLLIYKILQLFVMMILGFVVTKCKIVKPNDSIILSKISLYLLMPSAIINAFDFERTEGLMWSLGFAFLAALAVHIVLYVIDFLYGRFIDDNPVERASIMYSNAGNLIIPIVSFVIGGEWVIFSTAFLTVQLAFLWSHGARLFSAGEKFNVKRVLLNVNIITIAIGIVMLLLNWRLPTFVKDITTSFGDMLGPVAMLIAGMLAANIDFGKMILDKRLYRVVIARMVACPLIVLGVFKLLSLIPIVDAEKILLISYLASITPAASTVMQFAQIHGRDAEYATAINIFTTVVCVLTMPLFVMLYDFVL